MEVLDNQLDEQLSRIAAGLQRAETNLFRAHVALATPSIPLAWNAVTVEAFMRGKADAPSNIQFWSRQAESYTNQRRELLAAAQATTLELEPLEAYEAEMAAVPANTELETV